MSADSSTPQQAELFWASVENKRSIQRLCREIIFNKKSDRPLMYVSSVIENNEILPALKANGEPNGVPELSNWIEEADSQVIVHVNHAVREHKCKCIVVLSNDRTLLYYFCTTPLISLVVELIKYASNMELGNMKECCQFMRYQLPWDLLYQKSLLMPISLQERM